ncbi:uncharacterized protein TNCV_4440981 [Trichonephila clavipes]|nr:uncharacterized protein TNCV_4440981 [Trichonephila clavipes]
MGICVISLLKEDETDQVIEEIMHINRNNDSKYEKTDRHETLELCTAVLLSKFVKRVINALELESVKVYLWTDLMIVLSWLQKEQMNLKTFVQNRIAKIQDLLPRQWRHVPSNQNPADLISCGVDPDKLLNQELWWNGPKLLSDSVILRTKL